MSVKATVLIPTTGDRGLLLPMSVGSVLSQTVQDLEVFIIGDGVNEDTRRVVHDLMVQDDRIRFFDHPKDASRGEVYRHAALEQATGAIVCYLCDRDLMLRHHVATLHRLLRTWDFAWTAAVSPRAGMKQLPLWRPPVQASRRRAAVLSGTGGIALSCVGHTLAIYRRLPYGWRTTPPGVPTDLYMWQQFFGDGSCRATTTSETTILYFRRGEHPGLPTPQRGIELAAWYEKLTTPGWQDRFLYRRASSAAIPRIWLYRRLRTFLYNHPYWHAALYGNAAFRCASRITSRALLGNRRG